MIPLYKFSSDEIDIFLTVAKLHSFSEAAQELYISQPTVTKRVRHLEKEFGFPLFTRNSRHVNLTQAGKILYVRWSNLRTEWNNSIMLARQLTASAQSRIKIGILYGFDFEAALSEYLSLFQKQYPDINIDANVYGFEEIKTKSTDCDFLLTTNFEMENQFEYQTARLHKIPLYLAVSPSYSLAAKKSIAPADISHETFVIISSQISPNVMFHFDNAFRKYNAAPKFIAVDNIPSQLIKVIGNEGIAITSRAFTKGHESDIRLIPIKNFSLDLFCVCAWKRQELSAAAQKFRDFILSHKDQI